MTGANGCPRCAGTMIPSGFDDGDESCLSCGYVSYSVPPPEAMETSRSRRYTPRAKSVAALADEVIAFLETNGPQPVQVLRDRLLSVSLSRQGSALAEVEELLAGRIVKWKGKPTKGSSTRIMWRLATDQGREEWRALGQERRTCACGCGHTFQCGADAKRLYYTDSCKTKAYRQRHKDDGPESAEAAQDGRGADDGGADDGDHRDGEHPGPEAAQAAVFGELTLRPPGW